jgi:hypothetical protein
VSVLAHLASALDWVLVAIMTLVVAGHFALRALHKIGAPKGEYERHFSLLQAVGWLGVFCPEGFGSAVLLYVRLFALAGVTYYAVTIVRAWRRGDALVDAKSS